MIIGILKSLEDSFYMNKSFIITLLALVAAIAIGWQVYGMNQEDRVGGGQMDRASKAQILGFVVTKPHFVAQGVSLDKVEVWAIPTGTEITEASYQKIGDMTLTKMDTVESVEVQTWQLPIPQEPILATEIFIVGFNSVRGQIGKLSLLEKGATEIHDAIWATDNSAQIKIGETKALQGIEIKPTRIIEDSRCPLDVQCIWAGQLVVEVLLKSGTRFQTIQMKTGVGRVYSGKTIVLSSALPLKKAGEEIKKEEYVLTFVIEK